MCLGQILMCMSVKLVRRTYPLSLQEPLPALQVLGDVKASGCSTLLGLGP